MKMMLLFVFLVIGAFGCAPKKSVLRSASAGQLGCAPEEIKISHVSHTVGATAWTAVCNGEIFHCSEAAVVTCTEARTKPFATR